MKLGRIIAAAAAALVLFGAQSQALADQLSDIKARGVLRCAVPQDYPPFGFVGPDMKMQGYDVDTAAFLASELGVRCELIPVTGPNRIPFLQSGRADIVISTLGKTEERMRILDFTTAYAPTFLGVFGPAGEKVSQAADLKGRSVGATRGNIEDQLLTKMVPDGVNYKRYEDNNTTSQAYLSGQTDFICCLNFVAGALSSRVKADRVPELKFRLRNSPNYIGVRKGETALRDALNAALKKGFDNGTLGSFCQKYLGTAIPSDLLQQEPEL